MGTGASSRVQEIRLQQEVRPQVPDDSPLRRASIASDSYILETPRRIKDMVNHAEHKQRAYINEIEDLKRKLRESEECRKLLEQQLAEAEIAAMDISDQKTMLEDQINIFKMKNPPIISFEETINAKDLLIHRLEEDVKELQKHISTLKQRHKRKTKKLQAELVSAQQEAAIAVFEMKEKMQRMQEERIGTGGNISSSHSQNEGSSDESRNSLIVELSKQVSHQEEKISHLEEAIQQKDMKLMLLQKEYDCIVSEQNYKTNATVSSRAGNSKLHTSHAGTKTVKENNYTKMNNNEVVGQDNHWSRPELTDNPTWENSGVLDVSQNNGQRSMSASSVESGVSMELHEEDC
ncbi:myosin phosphatase Rho-interacting protein-like [Erpetoichthys calabaricus]|uniref:myosin phosphatase Rho-interacting protein-like n=1 Tax=Erpetoichthys calabaricus TaxID=27687 RepID=UPI0010A03CF8|nr:myosin phosphatase Rho-interacting protein-like [Erpetoichthys calabaricus]